MPSPSFAIVQPYEELDPPVWHVDLYRIEDPSEIDELGLDSAGDAVLLVEWPERAGDGAWPRCARACRSTSRQDGARRLDSAGAPGMGGAMAAPMIPPAHAPDFLAACGWAGRRDPAACRRCLASAAISGSSHGERSAVLMDAPPPHEDPRPFVAVAEWLASVGLSAPEILARDLDKGLLLLGDFGDWRLREIARRRSRRASASCTSSRPTSSSTSTGTRRCRACRRTASTNGSRS